MLWPVSFLSENPGLSAGEAVGLLLRYTDDAGAPGTDPEYGQGILDLGRIQNQNQAGVFDAALSATHVDSVNATDQTVPVLICAQNRGTEILPQIQISATVDGVPEVFRFGPVGVGETVYGTLSVSVSALLEQGAVEIMAEATIPGLTDANPANNGDRAVVFLKQSVSPVAPAP